MRGDDMLKLLSDHMEGGFLENIVDMFRHDRSLYEHLGGLMSDERGRVRLGAVALVEALRQEHGAEIASQVPALCELLRHEEPTVRADAAYLLGIIGSAEALPCLEAATDDEVGPVAELIEETIRELKAGS